MSSFWRKKSDSPIARARAASDQAQAQSTSVASQNNEAPSSCNDNNNLIASTSSAAPTVIHVCSEHNGATNEANEPLHERTSLQIPIYAALDSTQLAAMAAPLRTNRLRSASDLIPLNGHDSIGLSQAAFTSTPSTTRLWQSLVLPMVLACVIFLVALWTRQISLALNNDTLAMILILGAIFTLMSGAAFWISCDQYFREPPVEQQGAENASVSANNIASNSSDTPISGPYHHRHCPHYNSYNQQYHHQHHHQRRHHCQHANCARQLNQTSGAIEKCCGGISIIDCQPPDYYSAVLNSVPIHEYLLYNYDEDEINNIHERDTDADDDHLATLQLNLFDGYSLSSSDNGVGGELDTTKRSYLFPPSYDEVLPHK